MTRDDVIAALLARPKFGTGTGLQRMAEVTAALPAAPWFATGRALHVAGSQGKGTVATLAAAVLSHYGVRTGLFLSPHLTRFEERIVIAGQEIGADALIDAYRGYADAEARAQSSGNRFGAFEAMTGTALFAFARSALDTVVLEAGLGGRYDSTRCAGGSLVALTGIDREHLDLLGPTEVDVLRQKADLCPPGGMLAAGTLAPDLRRELEIYSRTRGFTARFVDDEVQLSGVRATPDGVAADVVVQDLSLPNLQSRLFGRVQMANATLALLLTKMWLERFGAFDATAFIRAARTALAQTPMRLRFEKVADTPAVYADVAHTPAAMHALADTVRLHLGPRKVVVVLGLSQGKSPAEIVRPLAPITGHILCTAATHRAIPPAQLLASLRRVSIGDIAMEAVSPLGDAMDRARELARAKDTAIIVTGSLFFARDVEHLLVRRGGAPDATL